MDYQLRISDVDRARRALAAAGCPVAIDENGVLVTTVPLARARAILTRARVQIIQEWPPAPSPAPAGGGEGSAP